MAHALYVDDADTLKHIDDVEMGIRWLRIDIDRQHGQGFVRPPSTSVIRDLGCIESLEERITKAVA